VRHFPLFKIFNSSYNLRKYTLHLFLLKLPLSLYVLLEVPICTVLHHNVQSVLGYHGLVELDNVWMAK
jgi:hypothetical protein